MQFSDKELKLLETMPTEAPEYYNLFVKLREESARQASFATHDIRNHATVLHGTLQLIEERMPEVKELMMWDNFDRGIHTLIDYLDSTSQLRYARICNKKDIDILGILWNIPLYIEEMFDNIHEEHPRTYTLNIPNELPLIHADYDRVYAAVIAIVRNAVEATADNSNIVIDAYVDGDMLTIKTTDCGNGFADEALENLFTAFYSDKAGHAGTGLAMARAVAAEHGGNVYVNSSANGTSVSFCIRM